MRPRSRPTPAPPPADVKEIRELLGRAARDKAARKDMHRHPALVRLGEIGGPLAYHALITQVNGVPLTEAELDSLTDRVVRMAQRVI